MIKQERVAEIMNTINDALEKIGFVATGYVNGDVFLEVMIEEANTDEQQTSSKSRSSSD